MLTVLRSPCVVTAAIHLGCVGSLEPLGFLALGGILGAAGSLNAGGPLTSAGSLNATGSLGAASSLTASSLTVSGVLGPLGILEVFGHVRRSLVRPGQISLRPVRTANPGWDKETNPDRDNADV